jgi:hypothetical protein
MYSYNKGSKVGERVAVRRFVDANNDSWAKARNLFMQTQNISLE